MSDGRNIQIGHTCKSASEHFSPWASWRFRTPTPDRQTFGLASYTVSKRLRELSIRVALGAQAQHILSVALGRMLILLASAHRFAFGCRSAEARAARGPGNAAPRTIIFQPE